MSQLPSEPTPPVPPSDPVPPRTPAPASDPVPPSDPAPRAEPGPLSESARQEAIRRLTDAAGHGHLALGDYSLRLAAASRARSEQELASIVADVPEPLAVAAAAPGRTQRMLHIIGGLSRKGAWRVGASTTDITVIGGADIDLTQATLAAPEVTMSFILLIGGVKVTVPSGVNVEMGGFTLLGGRKIESGTAAPPPGAPTVRVKVYCLLGGISVQAR